MMVAGTMLFVVAAVGMSAPERRPLPARSMRFEENCGQEHPEVRFTARGADAQVWLTPDEAVVAFVEPVQGAGCAAGEGNVLRLSFPGSRAVAPRGEGARSGVSHYLRGNDPEAWIRDIPSWQEVRLDALYPGVDLVYHTDPAGRLEYDFRLAPGVGPERIRMRFDGAWAAQVDAEGNLVLSLAGQEVMQRRPVVWQQTPAGRRQVSATYVRRDADTFGLALAATDPAQPTVIDPVLVWSTYLGGTDDELGYALTVDAAGSVYVLGDTRSIDFPTRGALQPASAGSFDAFVVKLTPAGDDLVYSTYIGGSAIDGGCTIAVSPTGIAWLLLLSDSSDFPMVNAAQPLAGGGRDAVVAALAPSGGSLLFSTYLGGGGRENPNGLAVDGLGRLWVAGTTESANFPVRLPLQATLGGTRDVFVARYSSAGAVQMATYLGGAGSDEGYAIAGDASGAAYVTGSTDSADFPVTPGVWQSSLSAPTDAFVTKIAPAAAALLWSSYLGGDDYDVGTGVAVEPGGAVVVVGYSASTDFPLVGQAQAFAGVQDAFVTRMSASGATLLYSTYLGGSEFDAVYGVGLTPAGEMTVGGWTESPDFPVAGPVQPAFGGIADAFATSYPAGGGAPAWSVLLGGTDFEESYAVAVGPDGDAYVAGGTYSTDFPTMAPFQAQNAVLPGDYTADVFVTRISASGSGPLQPVTGMKLGKSGPDDLRMTWTPGAGDGHAVWQTGDPASNPRHPRAGQPSARDCRRRLQPDRGVVLQSAWSRERPVASAAVFQVRALLAGSEGP